MLRKRVLAPRDDKYAIPPNGFNNIGATCWFNALVQTLLSSATFNGKLLADKRYLAGNRLASLWIDLVEHAQSGDLTRRAKIPELTTGLLKEFMTVVRAQKKVFSFAGTGNQCADEGLVLFIEAFKYEPLSDLFYNIHELVIACPSCREIVSRRRDKQIQIQIISDDISPPKTPSEEQLATTQFTKKLCSRFSEIDEYTCDKCRTKSGGLRRVEVLQAVRELILVYFPQFYTKETHWYPQSFTMPAIEMVPTEATADQPPVYVKRPIGTFVYNVISTTHHFGNQSSGHYYSMGLRNDGKVYKLNDSSISPGNLTPCPSVFVVLYELSTFIPVQH